MLPQFNPCLDSSIDIVSDLKFNVEFKLMSQRLLDLRKKLFDVNNDWSTKGIGLFGLKTPDGISQLQSLLDILPYREYKHPLQMTEPLETIKWIYETYSKVVNVLKIKSEKYKDVPVFVRNLQQKLYCENFQEFMHSDSEEVTIELSSMQKTM